MPAPELSAAIAVANIAVAKERLRILSALRAKTVLMQPADGPEVAAVPFAAVLDVLRGDNA
jgi:hypothetical protein